MRRKIKKKVTVNYTKLGTNYGGWHIPDNINLNENSIIYGAGVGEDISFDLKIQDKYNSNIYLIDPTERSKIHFEEIKMYYNKENFTNFTGDIQKDYLDHINNLNIKLEKIKYLDIGLWNKKDQLKFYKPENEKYVSHSLIEGMTSKNYDIVNVDSIKNIMKNNNHDHIDLLKLDIEGAEIKVLEQMFEDKIYPTYLLVEFDLLLKQKDKNQETDKIFKKINNLYNTIKNDNYNITYEKKKYFFHGRSCGIGNRLEELIFLETYCELNKCKINYYWNNNNERKDRKYPMLIKTKNINITEKKIDRENNIVVQHSYNQKDILKSAKNIQPIFPVNINIKYIAVHIRGKDKLDKYITPETDKSYMTSNIFSKIFDHTIKLLKHQDNRNIFICSDDNKIKNKMKGQLKDFNFLEFNLCENNVYNDFFSLVNSEKIYMCSKFSSFSIAASLVGNIPLVSYYKEEDTLLKRYSSIVELELLD